MLRLIGIFALIALVLGGLWGALVWSVYWRGEGSGSPTDRASASVAVTELGSGFYMLQGAGGNITVSTGADGILIVDTDYDWIHPKVAEALGSISKQPVVWVVNTHFHYDHTGANQMFRADGAEVISHRNTPRNLEAEGRYPDAPLAFPTVVFEDQHAFDFNGQTVQLVHTANAHTNGDVIAVFQPANIIAAGDVLATSGLPFISVDTGGGARGLVKSHELLLALSNDQTTFVPGHGDLASRQDVATTHRDLGRSIDYIARLKAIGVSARMLPLFHPMYAWPRDKRSYTAWEKFFARLAWETL